MKKTWTCNLCGNSVSELCPDGACRECHVSVGWDECCDGTYNARMLSSLGHSREEILENYPNAKIPESS